MPFSGLLGLVIHLYRFFLCFKDWLKRSLKGLFLLPGFYLLSATRALDKDKGSLPGLLSLVNSFISDVLCAARTDAYI
jgi:hypothetical protein